MKTIIFITCIFLTGNFLLAQNIINTLGTSGTFTIKSGATDFLRLSQSNGNISLLKNVELGNLVNSSGSVGVITKTGIRFLHNFAPTGADGNNTFLGLNSGNFTMSGTGTNASNNTCIGAFSLFSNTDGKANTSLGNTTLYSNTTGDFNTAIGYLSLSSNTTGIGNTAVGYSSLAVGTDFQYNTAVGYQSMLSNTGDQNTGIGYQSLLSNFGSENTAIGYQSLYSNAGSENSALGTQSLYNNSSGYRNSAFGYQSMYGNVDGRENVAIGNSTMVNGTMPNYCVAVGFFALNGNGMGNTAIGYNSMRYNVNSSDNTAVGIYSLIKNTTGDKNTGIGANSLDNNTTGSQNTAIGENSGVTVTTGSNLTLIGYNAQPSTATATNQITLGNSSVTSLRCNVTSISSLSDMRDKKNITDLSLGLDFIAKLKPRRFNWDKREWYDDNLSDGSKTQEIPTAGFIAQELDEAQTTENAEWLNLVLKDNPEKLEATYGNLLPVMVMAIQELSEENQKLKNENLTLEKRLAKLEEAQNHIIKTLEQIELKQTEINEVKITEK